VYEGCCRWWRGRSDAASGLMGSGNFRIGEGWFRGFGLAWSGRFYWDRFPWSKMGVDGRCWQAPAPVGAGEAEKHHRSPQLAAV
jgi:hypothetical protein